jgi:RNA polymerase sigma-70 factor (ECF subfamily)
VGPKESDLAAWIEKQGREVSALPQRQFSNEGGTPAAQDDRLLVRRIQAGERRAFEELLDAYEARVYRLALRFTGSVPDAEDVTQEIFLGIYRSLGNFRHQSALSTWIYRIAMNHCLEYRRKRKLDSIPYNEELTLTSQDWRENPAEAADRQELSEQVEAALKCLSPQHRDVVVLHELHGLTYQEVATALNVPVGTVKSRLSNAFRRLRTLLGGYAFEGTRTT